MSSNSINNLLLKTFNLSNNNKIQINNIIKDLENIKNTLILNKDIDNLLFEQFRTNELQKYQIEHLKNEVYNNGQKIINIENEIKNNNNNNNENENYNELNELSTKINNI